MPRTRHATPPAAWRQLDPTRDDLWVTEVVPQLPPDLEVQARILGAFTRRRAVANATDLLRAILAFVLLGTSVRQLGAWAVCAGLADSSHVAWHTRLAKCAPWLRWLLTDLLAPPLPPMRCIPRADGTILLVDATVLARMGGTGTDTRIHTGLDLLAGRLAQITVTDQQGGEHLGYYRLQPGDIIVADNGYGYRRSVATVKRQQAHLVVRIRPWTFPLETSAGTPLDVVAALRRSGPTIRAWQAWCTDTDGERYQVRLIARQLAQADADAARRRARQNAKKHGRTVQAETLLVAGWVLVITTLPVARWDAAAVLTLYRARWQVELVFKRMKSVLGMSTLRASTRVQLEVQVLATLVAWALQETEARWVQRVLQQLGAAEERIVSSWGVQALCIDILRQQVRGHWGLARLRACLPHLQRFVSSCWREDRGHQETTVRAWLSTRHPSTIVVRDREVWDIAA